MKIKTFILCTISGILFAALLFSGCLSLEGKEKTAVSPQDTIKYGDGNSNLYVLHENSQLLLEYYPVDPATSSSGTYSGGEYAKSSITDKQYERLTELIKKALENRENHIEERVKQSGVIIIIPPQGEPKRIILSPSSEEKADIEAFLQELLFTTKPGVGPS